MTHAAAATPPGWYPDPATGATRYWDGQQWGPVAPPTAQPVAPVGPAYSVTKTRKRTSHGLHLFLTIITAGLWGVFVWIPITIIHRFRHDKVKTRYR